MSFCSSLSQGASRTDSANDRSSLIDLSAEGAHEFTALVACHYSQKFSPNSSWNSSKLSQTACPPRVPRSDSKWPSPPHSRLVWWPWGCCWAWTPHQLQWSCLLQNALEELRALLLLAEHELRICRIWTAPWHTLALLHELEPHARLWESWADWGAQGSRAVFSLFFYRLHWDTWEALRPPLPHFLPLALQLPSKFGSGSLPPYLLYHASLPLRLAHPPSHCLTEFLWIPLGLFGSLISGACVWSPAHLIESLRAKLGPLTMKLSSWLSVTWSPYAHWSPLTLLTPGMRKTRWTHSSYQALDSWRAWMLKNFLASPTLPLKKIHGKSQMLYPIAKQNYCLFQPHFGIVPVLKTWKRTAGRTNEH